MAQNERFAWLSIEIAEVATPGFFLTDGPANSELAAAVKDSRAPIPDSYKDFVIEFGNARLYRQHVGYGIGVFAGPREANTSTGEKVLEIGYYLHRRAYFKPELFVDGGESPVFEGDTRGLVQAASGFDEWLRSRAMIFRRKLGKRRWEELVRGPPPFSSAEQRIVEARQKFRVQMVGLAENGDVLIEVLNGSDMTLPCLSIGVRSRKGGIEGVERVPIADILPRERKTIQRDCYKKQIPREDVEVFVMPDPTPADRNRYCEFAANRPAPATPVLPDQPGTTLP